VTPPTTRPKLPPTQLQVIDGLLAKPYADRLIQHWQHYGEFRTAGAGGSALGPVRASNLSHRPRPESTDVVNQALLCAVSPRADALANFVRTGGRIQHPAESNFMTRARTNYFRATYVADTNIYAPTMLRLLHHPALKTAAAQLFQRPHILPSQVYANLMLPGQELGVHTDVPEFRGADRRRYPLWLLVVMQHSGLFERWRTHLATAVLHLHADDTGGPAGGEFTYYQPNSAEAVVVPAQHNTALVFDADQTFHGVDRVEGDAGPLAHLGPGVELRRQSEQWILTDGHTEYGRWDSSQLRYSISWKARCFLNDEEHEVYRGRTDDLTYTEIMRALTGGMAQSVATSSIEALARKLIDHYVHFPIPPG
jgi:hypothetical protein